MKFFGVLLVLIVGSQAAVDHGLRADLRDDQRISSGVDAKSGENLDFCYFTAIFHTEWTLCSCVILTSQSILTAARCVYDPVELSASYMNITIPQLTGNDKTNKKSIIYVNDMPPFDPLMPTDTDVAVVTTVNVIPITAKKSAVATPDTAATAVTLVNTRVRVCGSGRILNNQTYAKNPQCTDMLVVDITVCQADPMGATTSSLAGCLSSISDNNVCPGDYGSGVWTYEVDSKNVITKQTLVGIVVGSLNTRRGSAPCKDGHNLIFLPYSAFVAFVTSAGSGGVAPAN